MWEMPLSVGLVTRRGVYYYKAASCMEPHATLAAAVAVSQLDTKIDERKTPKATSACLIQTQSN